MHPIWHTRRNLTPGFLFPFWLFPFWIALLAALLPLSASAARMAFNDVFHTNKKTEHKIGGVNHFVQDRQGFMWFGCEKGLARYDGASTRIYRPNENDPHSLPNEFIRDLVLDQHGIMWIATAGGLCFYNAQLDRFVCADHHQKPWTTDAVRALLVDRSGNLYFGTSSGLYRISPDRQEFVLEPIEEESGTPYTGGIAALAIDSQGIIWIGTDQRGLISLNPETGVKRYFRNDETANSTLAHNKVSTLTVDKQDRIWIGTYGGGLSILNAERNHFENHAYDNYRPGTLLSNVIWDIFVDSVGNIWVAVDQGGLARYDPHQGFIAIVNNPHDPTSLGANQVRTIYEDNNGDLWIGAFPSGVNFHNRSTRNISVFRHEPDNPKSLSHSAILDIHRDTRGNIWVGTENGLNLFDPIKGTFTRYPLNPETAGTAKAVLSIGQFDDNTLWLGTWSGGLLSFDLDRRIFESVDTSPADGVGKNTLFIWDIVRDSSNNIWLATEFDGVAFFNRATHEFSYLAYGREGRKGLPHNFVRDVLEDRNGNIWIATNGGLTKLPPDPHQPSVVYRRADKTHQFLSDRPFALYEDSRGRIWIGSEDNNAFVYDPTTDKFRPIGQEQGLPPGMSTGFAEDLQGNIWLMTTNGLAKIDGKNFSLRMFGTENGLAGNNLNRNAAIIDPSGKLYLGSADGLNVFHPATLEEDYPDFPVWLTEMRVMNEPVKVGTQGSPLQQAITFTRKVGLDHRDLMVAFDFAALNYRHSQDTRYAYKLDGFDPAWNFIDTSRSATYTNIPSGEYTFRVKASRGQNEWVEMRGLKVVMRPAPWRTWWAYFIYAVIGLTACYFFAHYFRLRGHTKIYKTLSATDPLTGLANRAGMISGAKNLFAIAKQNSTHLCVLFADIDYFKRINDTRGHDSGDHILIEIADIFRGCFRQSDLIGRWGGEEFMIICPSVNREDGLRLAEELRQKVAEHIFEAEHSPYRITLSLGVAFAKQDEDFESVVKRADSALYTAKGSGRNRVIVAEN